MKQTEQTAVQDPRELADQLAIARDLEAARRTDELTRHAAAAAHDRSLADVGEAVRQAELDRAQRAEADAADAELARLYRTARTQGERIRIKATMARSAEARALRLESTRIWTQRILLPLYLGFGAWSTAGVQAGLVRITGAEPGSFLWWASWFIEPVLILGAGVLIWARARIRASGGDLGTAAMLASGLCLTASLVLNLMSAHSKQEAAAKVIAPAFAALMAWLSGLVDDAVAKADPWTDATTGQPAQLLADLIPDVPTVVTGDRSSVITVTDDRRSDVVTGDRPAIGQSVTDTVTGQVTDAVTDGSVTAVTDVTDAVTGQTVTDDGDNNAVTDDRPVTDSQVSLVTGQLVTDVTATSVAPVTDDRSADAVTDDRLRVLAAATDDRSSVSLPVTGQLVVADDARDNLVMGWLAADPHLKGAEIARRLDVSPKTGQRLRGRAVEMLKAVAS